MADLWLPGFERRPGKVGAPYDETRHPKFGWHTWEGTNWSSAERAFAPYPPHIAVNPIDRIRRQYVPLNLHAFAFAGSDADDSYVIQVEVAGFAGESHNWPEATIKWLGEWVVRPIAQAVGIPPVVVPQGFHGEGEGLLLASKRSPIRFKNAAQLDAFAGHCGHQHMPDPDQHWDPGRLPIARILAYARTLDQPEEFTLDAEVKAAFKALNARLDTFEKDRWRVTTMRVRKMFEHLGLVDDDK